MKQAASLLCGLFHTLPFENAHHNQVRGYISGSEGNRRLTWDILQSASSAKLVQGGTWADPSECGKAGPGTEGSCPRPHGIQSWGEPSVPVYLFPQALDTPARPVPAIGKDT